MNDRQQLDRIERHQDQHDVYFEILFAYLEHIVERLGPNVAVDELAKIRSQLAKQRKKLQDAVAANTILKDNDK